MASHIEKKMVAESEIAHSEILSFYYSVFSFILHVSRA